MLNEDINVKEESSVQEKKMSIINSKTDSIG